MTGAVFTPFGIGGVRLRNRIVRSAAFEGMAPSGIPSASLARYHAEVAAGGAALTTVAYASVSADGRTYGHQISLDFPDAMPGLRRVTDGVHREGAAAAIQIGHCGYFANPSLTHERPIGPSAVFNRYGLLVPRVMTDADIDRVTAAFGRAAATSVEAGFDAVEVHAGHGYLLSQFLTPHTNRRRDRWGGSLGNRFRIVAGVMRAVRAAVPPGFPVMVKMNLSDGFPGGLEIGEAVQVARMLESEGADALVLSGGFVSRTPMYVMRGDVPFEDMYRGQTSLVKKAGLLVMGRLLVKAWPFTEAYFREDARRVRAAVRIPLVLVGGIRTLSVMEDLVAEGFDMLAMARPLIIEPDLPRRMERGEATTSRCEPCNKCIAYMDHELRRSKANQAVKLGSYEQNVGLKGQVPRDPAKFTPS